jgi:iron complex outermembrane receptor protein
MTGGKMYDPSKTISSTARRRLMATVSTAALIASAWGCGPAFANETSKEASIWMELGWQADSVHFSDSDVGLPLGSSVSSLTAPLMQTLNPARSNGGEGKILYRPDGGDWQFSASIRFGRSGRTAKINQALAPIPTTSFATYKITYPFFPSSNKSDVRHVPATRVKLAGDTSSTESHVILDFQAGKDVGIGLFGHGSTSTLSAGVRFAQFTASRKASNFQETKGLHFQSSHFMTTIWPGYITRAHELWTEITANGSSSQKFDGLGPSIRWEASAPLWNDPRGGNISLDWGVNAAVLFGKQVKKIRHQTENSYHCFGKRCIFSPPYENDANIRTSRNITVPNIGGFAGISLRYHDAQVKFGYRADLFLNAVDAGIGTRKSSSLLLHGPYASISIGFP